MTAPLEALLARIERGETEPLYLVWGDRVLAEPAAVRVAEALAARSGCEVAVHRRPARIADLLADLETYSLFSPAKVVLAVETAVLADREAAADLIDEAAEGVADCEAAEELTAVQQRAARRLLQALRLFEIAHDRGSVDEVLARLPDWALAGGRTRSRRRGRKAVEELRTAFEALLRAALRDGLEGWGEGELAQLSGLLERGLPDHHGLVLAESAVAQQHPLVAALERRQAMVRIGQIEGGRGGAWRGLEQLAIELQRQTGAAITDEALAELGRRTLLEEGGGPGARTADADSTARLAAEYRKLATLSAGRTIDLSQVEETVEDRGQEDVWQILDAIGAGRGGEALRRIDRLQAAADDPLSARLALFAQLAAFCRHLSAIAGVMKLTGVPPGEQSYGRFKARLAPALQADLPEGGQSPLRGLHPFRLHRAYLAASRMPAALLDKLPWRVLETELLLKGESAAADTALAALAAELAAAVRD